MKESTSDVKLKDIWYRFIDYRTAPMLDEFENPMGDGRSELRLDEYEVTKITSCGVWLNGYRFVLINAHKRFAHPTINEAEVSFLARKERQHRILSKQLENVKAAIRLMQERKQNESARLRGTELHQHDQSAGSAG